MRLVARTTSADVDFVCAGTRTSAVLLLLRVSSPGFDITINVERRMFQGNGVEVGDMVRQLSRLPARTNLCIVGSGTCVPHHNGGLGILVMLFGLARKLGLRERVLQRNKGGGKGAFSVLCRSFWAEEL